MDEAVARSLARWPGVPAVYGWLRLDRRGRWRLREPGNGAFGTIANEALNAFIARNYASDDAGRWYFQNGPQRVYASLDYTPLVARLDGVALRDQCGRVLAEREAFVDDEGSILVECDRGLALLDDRDLYAFAERRGDAIDGLARVARAEVAVRFGFDPSPAP